MSSKLSIESYNVYLLHACREGYELGSKQVPVVVSLLESGADVNTRDELGNTPLHWVCHSLRNKNSTGNDTQEDHSIHAGSLIILLLRMVRTSLLATIVDGCHRILQRTWATPSQSSCSYLKRQ